MQEKQERLSRRRFVAQALKGTAVGAAVWNLPVGDADGAAPVSANDERRGRRTEGVRMKIGLVTYNLAKDWDVDTIIKRCEETGFEGVELRTTHAHKVESNLSGEEQGGEGEV